MVGMIPIDKIKVHPNNVKEHPDSQISNLIQLIQWVGFKDPIVLDKTNTVRAGHGRLIAAKKLGMEEVPYVLLEGLTKKQMDLFIYMDNQINYSPWIKENIQIVLEDIPQKDLELFDVNWEQVIDQKYKEEEDPIPEPGDNPQTTPGQIYQLDQHRIMCADNQIPDNYKKLLENNQVKQLNTDPPYGVMYGEKNAFLNSMDNGNRIDKQYKNDETDHDYLSMFKVIFDNIPFTDYNTVYIWSGGQKLEELRQAMVESKVHFSQYLIWLKNNHVLGRQDYAPKNEFCLYGWKTHHEYYGGFKTNILEYDKPLKNELHPTQKPPELIAETITDGTKPNDIVLDVFAGSGSSLISCEQTGRTFYGMELDPAYVEVIVQRWENFTGKKAKLLQ